MLTKPDTAPNKVENFKVLVLTCIANLCELYDFTLFVVLLPILVEHFFPYSADITSTIIIGYATFAVSFLILPFGSILWGYIGDKFGSYKIFRATLLLMAFPSLAIALLPTFSQIGWLAPVLLITLRLIQGISASGEVLGAKLYAFECLGKGHHLLASSLISAFGAIGVTGAMLVGSFLASQPSGSGYWRLAFMVGGGSIFIIMLIRMFSQNNEQRKINNNVTTFLSVMSVVRDNIQSSTQGFILSGMLGILSYFMHCYLINFQVMNLGYTMLEAYQNAKIGLGGTIVAAALLAVFHKFYQADTRALLLKVLIICVLLVLPLYYIMLIKNPTATTISFAIMGGLLGLFASVSSVHIINAFSPHERCRGALLVNAFGVAIFGGSTPMVMTILAATSIYLPGVMLWLGCVICLMTVCYGKKY